MSGTSTAPISTKGTTLSYCATSGGTYVVIPCHEITAPKLEIHEILITDLASNFETPLPAGGLTKYGTCDFACYHSEVLQTQLVALYGETPAGTAGMYWKVTFPDASVVTFQGYLSALEPVAAKANAVWEYKCKITVCTPLVWTPGTL